MDAIPLATVLARPDIWCGGHFAEAALPAVASGFAQLDQELPGGGWPRGALTELLCDGAGQGEIALLLPALRTLCAEKDGEGGWLVLIAPPYPVHAGAWAAAGIPLERLLIVEAGSHRSNPSKRAHLDALWAAEQALNSDAPSAVLCWSMQAENKAVRRLQLAAATSHAASFLIRPLRAGMQASAAPLRLSLETQKADKGAIAINILKRRGPPPAQPLHLSLPRPAKWRTHQPPSHGNALVRNLPAAAAARHSSSPALR